MKPLLILVHGSLSAAVQWHGYADLLPNADILAPDLPGHGTRAAEPFSLANAWADIDRAILSAEPGQPVILAGHSLGGYLSLLAAAAHPERLVGLALIGATGNPSSKLSTLYRSFGWISERLPQRPLLAWRQIISDRMRVPPERVPDHLDYAVMAETWRCVIDHVRPELIASVTCPILIVNGEYDQMRVDEKRFTKLAPNAEVVTIPKASHLAPLTHAEAVATALTDFIERVTPPAERLD